ncbi:acyltransferase family protein [Burkholderia multivorans]|jgi:peptidoglycan/LPS O-acetylase OafA/YrhL|uniref:Acyltransferase n=1 Tax=Burkholderia multivorans TaxID=87883 RepID=A0AAP2HGK3_9BURK|nr:acyltransferase [Burkholderia multivorans]KVS18599.1 acyltransferase [Burkholderia multivorans]MBU9147638.1 acyltransferase [Burkholderia multivorans]MBU9182410.1 acyltransferase [Burkholderia multivorans]MBU9248126.1 acyltransferase [Burkholderia multivorans]MBU9254161.1 acyltransferase [Burkholderia multivorans]
MQAFSGSSFAAPPVADRKEHVIDAMRGFAALLVAYFHCRQVVWVGMQSFHRAYGHALDPSVIVGYLTFPFAWGSAGVPIFFVISGYCIHRNAALKLAADPGYRLDVPNFWARRFARIYPVLLAALLLTLALDAISLQIQPVSHKIRDIGVAAFLVNLFSLQGVAGYTYGSNGALWTLSLEVQFYAIYPLLFAVRRRVGMPAVVAAVALVNVVSAWLLERHDLQFFTSYWLSWTIGAWIADVRAQPARGAAAVPSRGWYGAAALLLAAGCGAFHFGQYGAFQLWAAGFACFLYRALACPPRPTLPLRVLGWFGDFSYSLYLIHLPLFVCLGSVLFRSQLQLSIWPSFGFIAVAIPVAYLFYLLFERPAMRWSASLKPTRTARVVAAAPERAA